MNKTLKPVDIDVVNGKVKAVLAKVFRNRAIFYSLGIVAIIGAMVFGGISMTGTPEFANASISENSVNASLATNDSESPARVRDKVSGMDATHAVNFLAFQRWNGSNALPSPNVGILNVGAMISAGIAMFGSFLFAIASVIIWIMGVLLSMALNLDLLSRLALTIDHTFALVTNSILTGSSVLLLLLVILIGFTFFNFIRGRGRQALLGFGVGAAAIGALLGMSIQANKNHMDTPDGNKSPIASLASAPSTVTGGLITSDAVNVSRPDNWATFSPGWLIAEVNLVAKAGTGVVTSMVTGITSAVGTGGLSTSGSGLCGRYIDAMYSAFDASSAAQTNPNMQILKSYDTLARAVYFSPYVSAAYGSSVGASNAWCRIAEVQAKIPAGEQAYLSNEAGLYTELVGWTNRQFDGKDTVVNPNGTWRDAFSASRAGDFFGTNSYGTGAIDKMVNYFAACTWGVNEQARVQPEWQNVISANVEVSGFKFPWELAGIAAGVIDGTSGPLSDSMCRKVVEVGQKESGFNNKDEAAKQFAYIEKNNAAIFGVFGATGTYNVNFSPAVASGQSGSLEYYKTTQGSSSFYSILFGIITLVLAIMMAKYMLPLVLGGIIAQVVATLALMMLPVSIILLVIPVRWSRKLITVTGLTVLSSFLVNLLFVAMSAITLMVIHLLLYILKPVGAVPGSVISISGGAGDLISVLQVGLAVFLGLKITRMIMTQMFAIDMKSLGKASMSAGLLSGGAILRASGYQPPQMFNGRMPDAGMGPKGAIDEARTRIGNGIHRVTNAVDVIDSLRGGSSAPETVDGDLSNAQTSTDDIAQVTGASGEAVINDAMNPAGTAATPGATATGPGVVTSGPGVTGDAPLIPANGEIIAAGSANPSDGLASVTDATNENMTPAQRAASNRHIVELANGVLGNHASMEELDAILADGEIGDLLALGTTPERLDQIIDNNEVPQFATNGGASPIQTKEQALANWNEARIRGDEASNAPQFNGMTLAESILARSVLSPGAVGVSETGQLLNRPATGVQPASNSGDQLGIFTGLSSAINPDDIPMVLDSSFLAHEGTSESGQYWSSGAGAKSINDFGADPDNVFEWKGQNYSVDDVIRAVPGLAPAAVKSGRRAEIAKDIHMVNNVPVYVPNSVSPQERDAFIAQQEKSPGVNTDFYINSQSPDNAKMIRDEVSDTANGPEMQRWFEDARRLNANK